MAPGLDRLIRALNEWGAAHWAFAVEMSLQVGLVVAILGGLDLLLLRRGRAALRYALWSLVLAKLLLPVSLVSTTLPILMLTWTERIRRIDDTKNLSNPSMTITMGLQVSSRATHTSNSSNKAVHLPLVNKVMTNNLIDNLICLGLVLPIYIKRLVDQVQLILKVDLELLIYPMFNRRML